MPTLDPTTPEPTKVPTQSPSNALGDKTCLKIQTGSNSINAGYLIVSVDTGNGYGEIASGFHAVNEQVVLEDSCFIGLLGVQVTNKNKDGWGGSITTSVNYGEYVPMICTTGCEDDGGTNTSYIFVDGNESTVGTSEASALCFNGMPDTNNVCTLNVAGGGTPTTSNPTLAPSKSPVALSNSPTASPTASPVPSEVCVRITTDEEDEPIDPNNSTNPSGYVDISLDISDDDGYFQVSNATKEYQAGEVVLDECYQSQEVLIQVSGPSNTGWRGTIEFSTDNKATYTPFNCADCTGDSDLAAPIAVDKNSNGGSEDIANCLDGNVCNLRQEVDPDSTPSPTSSPSLSPVSASAGPTSSPTSSPVPSEVCVRIRTDEEDNPIVDNSTNPSGYVNITLNSGSGYELVSNVTKKYQAGEVVLEACYPTVEGIQVTGPDNNGWEGNIEWSIDNKQTYNPFKCLPGQCTGATNAATPIAVDLNSNGGGEDICNCLNGDLCTLVRNFTTSMPTIAPTSSPTSSPTSVSCYD